MSERNERGNLETTTHDANAGMHFRAVYDELHIRVRNTAGVVGMLSSALGDRPAMDREEADRVGMFYWLREEFDAIERELERLSRLHHQEPDD